MKYFFFTLFTGLSFLTMSQNYSKDSLQNKNIIIKDNLNSKNKGTKEVFDLQGNLLEYYENDGHEETIKRYDEKQRLIEESVKLKLYDDINTTYFFYDENNKIVKKIDTIVDGDDVVLQKFIVKYDQLGNIVQGHYYKKYEVLDQIINSEYEGKRKRSATTESNISNPKKRKKVFLKFDTLNNVIEERVSKYNPTNEEFELNYTIYTTFDSSTNQKIQEEKTDYLNCQVHKIVVTKLNEAENKLAEIIYNPNREIVSRTVYKYNLENNPIEEKQFDKHGKLVTLTKHLYSNKGEKLKETKVFNANQQLVQRKTYHYKLLSFNPKPITVKYYNENNKLYKKIFYEYKYIWNNGGSSGYKVIREAIKEY